MEHNKYFIGLVDIIAKLEHQLEESMKTKEQITQGINLLIFFSSSLPLLLLLFYMSICNVSFILMLIM